MALSLGKKSLGLFFAAALMAVPYSAHALLSDDVTVREFDAAEQADRSELVSRILGEIYSDYQSSEDTVHKAQCMDRLYATQNTSGTPKLFTLLMHEFQDAREVNPDAYKIEDIIFGTIEDACQEPAPETVAQPDIKDAPEITQPG